MDCRYYEVTRESGFDRDIDGLVVTDFSYHDDIRILTQGGAESSGECISNIREHL